MTAFLSILAATVVTGFLGCAFTAIIRSLGGQSRDAEDEAEARPVIRLVSSR
jgi:hypothetical protein